MLCSPLRAAQTAKVGDFVTVDYTGTLDDGTVFDTSRKEGRTPLEFEIGGGMVGQQADWLQVSNHCTTWQQCAAICCCDSSCDVPGKLKPEQHLTSPRLASHNIE